MIQQYPSRLLERAVQEFSQLPGIGRKTALRLVLHLLRQDADDVFQFTDAISRMKERNKSFIETDEKVRVNRANSYMFYSPIGSTDWILVFSVETFAIDIIGIVLGFAMLFIITFVLLVTFFVCRLTIQRVAKPLRQLAASADEMADGQFSATLPSINSHDEIHLLRDSFANMQRSLSSYGEELKTRHPDVDAAQDLSGFPRPSRY